MGGCLFLYIVKSPKKHNIPQKVQIKINTTGQCKMVNMRKRISSAYSGNISQTDIHFSVVTPDVKFCLWMNHDVTKKNI